MKREIVNSDKMLSISSFFFNEVKKSFRTECHNYSIIYTYPALPFEVHPDFEAVF